LRKIELAARQILLGVYTLSTEVFVEAKKRVNASVVPGSPVVVTDDVVKALFSDWQGILVSKSKSIGTKAISDYTLGVVLEAWLLCKTNIRSSSEMVRGVPIVWKPLDEFFRQFMTVSQSEVFDELVSEEEGNG